MRSIDMAPFSRRDKDLPIPELVFIESSLMAGCYYRPVEYRYYNECVDRHIDECTPVIVVSTIWGDEWAGNTLAHEWRHHWQAYNGLLPIDCHGFDASCDYTAAVIKYYRQRHELDALAYSLSVEPDEEHREHFEWATSVPTPTLGD